MVNCKILSEEDVHKIAYLTINGWQISSGKWRKTGFQQQSLDFDFDYNQKITDEFDLEEAYWEQVNFNEKSSAVK